MDERSLPRFFVEGAHDVGDVVALQGADARKVRLVLRRATGDAVELFDSTGSAFVGSLRVDARGVDVRIERRASAAREPALQMTLAQAIPKGAKMDFVIEKATEAGAARIVPLVTERTIGDPGPAKVDRWRRLARSAAQQSGRATIPAIDAPIGLAAFLSAEAGRSRLIVPWELAERVALRERLPALLAGAKDVAIVIGPEGGLSHAEVDAARAAGATVVSLGERILRTETAGLVLLSALLYAAGDL